MLKPLMIRSNRLISRCCKMSSWTGRSVNHLGSYLGGCYVPPRVRKDILKSEGAEPRYPGGLAWQVEVSKRVVRKSPPFQKFQRFLVGETEVVRCTVGKQG